MKTVGLTDAHTMSHLSDATLSDYRARRLAPLDLLEADDHLVECASCRARLEEDTTVAAPTMATPSWMGEDDDLDDLDAGRPFHLDSDLLGGYVDNTLSPIDREIAETHLATCARCREEAEDLVRFRAVLSTYPVVPATPAVPVAEPEKPVRRSWFSWAAWGPVTACVLAGGAFFLGRTTVPTTPISTTTPVPTASVSSDLAALQSQNAALDAQLKAARRDAESARTTSIAARTQITRLQSENGRLLAAVKAAGVKQPVALPTPNVVPSAGGAAPRLTTPPTLLASLNDNAAKRANLPADLRRTATDALRMATLPALNAAARTSLAALMPAAGGVLRGGESGDPTAFGPITPLGTRLQSAQPTFKWRPLAGAAGYVVRVFTLSGGDYQQIAESGSLPAGTTVWTPAKPLPSGAICVWQVAATMPKSGGGDTGDGSTTEEVVAPRPPAPEARFAVLPAAEAASLKTSLEEANGSHLLRALALWKAGVWQEAAVEIDALKAANPNSPQVKKLAARFAEARVAGIR